MNIVIIDDDPEDREILCEALQELYPTVNCITVQSCEHISGKIENPNEIDAIFIDGHMHPMDGKSCFEALLKFIDRKRTKMILHSGSLSPSEQTGLTKLGIDHMLTKASTYTQLKTDIAEILSKLAL